MADLNDRIRADLGGVWGRTDQAVRNTARTRANALRAVLDLCNEANQSGNLTPGSVYGPRIRSVIARELGVDNG